MNKCRLIISLDKFQETLEERISIGKTLRTRGEDTVEAYKKQVFLWDSYNSDFFKTVFSQEDNPCKIKYDNRIRNGNDLFSKIANVLGDYSVTESYYNFKKISNILKSGIIILESILLTISLMQIEEEAKVTNNSCLISKEFRDEISDLIIDNKIKDALEKIKDKYPNLTKEVNLHLSNLHSWKERERIGIINYQDLNLNLIRIKLAILELLEQ